MPWHQTFFFSLSLYKIETDASDRTLRAILMALPEELCGVRLSPASLPHVGRHGRTPEPPPLSHPSPPLPPRCHQSWPPAWPSGRPGRWRRGSPSLVWAAHAVEGRQSFTSRAAWSFGGDGCRGCGGVGSCLRRRRGWWRSLPFSFAHPLLHQDDGGGAGRGRMSGARAAESGARMAGPGP